MYDPADMPPPPAPDWDRATDWLKRMSAEAGMDRCTEEQIRRVIASYHGLISYVDDQCGRLFRHLEARGLMDTTWIIYTADHGDFTGEHGMMTKAETFYDCNVHVPLVIRGPTGALDSGVRCAQQTESIDIALTICQIAGVRPAETMHGHSLLDTVGGVEGTPGREAVFAIAGHNEGPERHNVPQGIVASSRLHDIGAMVRTPGAKLVSNPEYGDELYVLDSDPAELCNRAGDADAAALESELRSILGQWLDAYPAS